MTHSVGKPKRMKGRLLAAMPALQDPNFFQTLVYVAEHDAKGALGFVLNRPLGNLLGDVASVPGLPDAVARVPVFYGGPVQRAQIVLALFEPAGKSGIACRLNLPVEQIEAHLAQQNAWGRAFAGYAGWGEGQLDRELREGAWKVCRAEASLFEDHLVRGLWPFFISGDQRWKLVEAFLPRDPASN